MKAHCFGEGAAPFATDELGLNTAKFVFLRGTPEAPDCVTACERRLDLERRKSRGLWGQENTLRCVDGGGHFWELGWAWPRDPGGRHGILKLLPGLLETKKLRG